MEVYSPNQDIIDNSSIANTSTTGASSLGNTLINVSLGVLLSILMATSILGNILVCAAIWTDRNLRKLSNLFFISLAVADLLLSILVMPFAIVNDLLGEWKFGKEYCNLWISTDVMCCTASIISLLAISLERYIHIKDPLQYTEWLTRKSVPVSILIIWLTSGLISFLPISLGLHAPPETISNQYDEFNQTIKLTRSFVSNSSENATTLPLMLQIHGEEGSNGKSDSVITSSPLSASNSILPPRPQCQLDFSPIYSITSSLVSFFLPCIIMLIIYFHLFAIAKHHLKEMKAHNQPLVRLRLINELQQHREGHQGQNGSTPVAEDQGKKKRKKKQTIATLSDSPLIQEHKAAITIGIIMGVFLLCWMPFFVVNVVAGFCKDCISATTFKVLTWLGYSNSAFNPIIYTIFNTEFRNAFRRILSHLGMNICRMLHHGAGEANNWGHRGINNGDNVIPDSMSYRQK